MAAFRDDQLTVLTNGFDGTADVWRFAPRRLCVANPEAAREVLGNRQGAFVDTSDFFHTRHGVFGSRAAQLEIGRSARTLLRQFLDGKRGELPGLVRRRLAPSSTWPDAGNLVIHDHLRSVLLHEAAPPRLHATIDQVISRAVLAGARERHAAMSRILFRHNVMCAIGSEILARRNAGEPRDLLDVVANGAEPGAAPRDLAEVYLSFLFATVGSIGFALGWSVYLAGLHPGTHDEPDWIVREALRLWPVAWLFAREPSRRHELAGIPVGPRDQVAVCTYLVHRHPRYWDRPEQFVPGRWARTAAAGPAFLPFGFGPHSCPGTGLTLTLLADLIRVITHDWRLSVIPSGGGPHLGPALAPPTFTAELRHPVDARRRR
jgi:hypothetical protein